MGGPPSGSQSGKGEAGKLAHCYCSSISSSSRFGVYTLSSMYDKYPAYERRSAGPQHLFYQVREVKLCTVASVVLPTYLVIIHRYCMGSPAPSFLCKKKSPDSPLCRCYLPMAMGYTRIPTTTTTYYYYYYYVGEPRPLGVLPPDPALDHRATTGTVRGEAVCTYRLRNYCCFGRE